MLPGPFKCQICHDIFVQKEGDYHWYCQPCRDIKITEMEDCEHKEHDHGICLDCEKDITNDLVGEAEWIRDQEE